MDKHTGANILMRVAAVAIPAAAGDPLVKPLEAAFKTLVGLSTGYSIDGNRFEFDKEFGDTDNLWRSGSTITDRGWAVPLEAYWKNNSDGAQIVENAIWQKDEAGVAVSPYVYLEIFPIGKIDGAKFVHGFATVDDLDDSYGRTDALTRSLNFTGEGELVRGRHVVV